jgi:glycosyltransferase involved in cell wall biosynthesis
MPASPPLVAVVTPVYNGAKFIDTAIKAVQAQTYRPLVHCILDNASTDGTDQIIARAASGEIPVITRRNAALLPQVDNFNAVLGLIPPDARYFKILCADDFMTPDAIAAMMAVALSAPEVTVVGGVERVNGAPRPHRFPAETSIYEGANAIARVFADEARIPGPHMMFRTDQLRAGEAFFDADFIAFDTEAVLHVLARGGRFGFVHEPVLDSVHHAEMLTKTLDMKIMSTLWEHYVFLERFGPGAMSNAEFARVRRGQLRVLYRRLLWWRVAGRGELYKRDLERLRARGLGPGLAAYLDSILAWPAHLYAKRVSRPAEPKPWPAEAVKPGAA